MIIRFAQANDISSIRDIYSQYIDSNITFEYTLPTMEEFTQRVMGIWEKYPYLVCVNDGKLIGYAYAHESMQRPAYQWNAELSVYVHRDFHSMGVGSLLYRNILMLLQKQGIRNVYSLVTLPNPASEALHLSFGFEQISTMKAVGYKNCEWHNVGWFHKSLQEDYGVPTPIAHISALLDKQSICLISPNTDIDSSNCEH